MYTWKSSKMHALCIYGQNVKQRSTRRKDEVCMCVSGDKLNVNHKSTKQCKSGESEYSRTNTHPGAEEVTLK